MSIKKLRNEKMKNPCIYIMASRKDGALYVGVTSNLLARVWSHKNQVVHGHTEKYNIKLLVYFEQHLSIED